MQNFVDSVEQALRVLREGGVILYPTEIGWSLGCDATNEKTIAKVLGIHPANESKSLVVLVADEREVLQYVAAPDLALFDFLDEQDRPTTIILDGAINLPERLIAEDGSVAMRIVQDEFCRHLVKRLRRPIVSASATITGEPLAGSFKEISEEVKGQVDHIVKWRQEDQTFINRLQVIRWKDGKVEYIRK